jgi:hypothetical protein
MPKREDFVKKIDGKLKELEKEFLEAKAQETIEARDALVGALKEHNISLPAAIFALEIVKWELLRGQYEAFMGHVKIPEHSLPLSEKPSS